MNFINQKKTKEKENTKLLERILKEYSGEYLENIDFDYDLGFGKEAIQFTAKEVEFRRDLLKKFGIPLELSTGKIKTIKLKVKSLISLKNFSLEISDLELNIETIHINKDYKKNFFLYRQKILNEWENKHKKIFNSMTKNSLLESFIVDRLIPIKIDIKNIKIVINDTISSKRKIYEIVLRIDSIHSVGTNSMNQEIDSVDNEDLIFRTLEINGFSVKIFRIDNINSEKRDAIYLGTILNDFDMGVKLSFLRSYNKKSLKETPLLDLIIEFKTPLIINLTIQNINILQNVLNYLTKIKKVEKYWINRPDFKEEGKINEADSIKWFKYAFRVLRNEIRNNKRQNYELITLIEKIISMEKYIQYYKESHKLIIAPWIHQKDHKMELQNLENKMSIDDIIYCRELAFAELLTEGRAFCASGEVGEGYKPFVHLWEFYVNDLRTKWMNKDDSEIKTIKLTDNERRELMTLWKNDRDMVLLSYIKGEPNHPNDKIFQINLKFDLIMINFLKAYEESERKTKLAKDSMIEFQKILYHKKLKEKCLNFLSFSQFSLDINDEQLESYIKDEIKIDNNIDSDEDDIGNESSILSRSNNKNNSKEQNSSINEKEESCIYIDDINVEGEKNEEESIKDINDINNEQGNFTNRLLRKKTSLSNKKSIKNIACKTLFSFVFLYTSISGNMKRNEAANGIINISKFKFIDHDYTFIKINSYKNLIDIFRNRIFDEIKGKNNTINMSSSSRSIDENIKFKDSIFSFLIDILKQQKLREIILGEYFKDENKFFNNYEDYFGFKRCKEENLGLTTLKNHFSKIVIDFLINSQVFSEIRERMMNKLNTLKTKKKNKNLNSQEQDEFLKKILVKNFDKQINKDNKRLYDPEIQEKFIKTMVSDLNSIFEILGFDIICYVISFFYVFYLHDSQFSSVLVEHLSFNEAKEQEFLKINFKRKGREYPNYIMNSVDDLIKNQESEIENDEPNITINGEIKQNVEINLTNESIAEIKILMPEITAYENNIYVGNILNDLTKSYVNIFDDYRKIKAKRRVFEELKKKNDINYEPIEMVYIDNISNHIKEITNKENNMTFEFNENVKMLIRVYDKIHFYNTELNSCITLELKDLIFEKNKIRSLVPFPNNDNNLPENYEMSKICKTIFCSHLKIGSIELSIDNNVPILNTDIEMNKYYSLMKNSLYIPDSIMDVHTNQFEFNLYPCVFKLIKNIQNISSYEELYEFLYNRKEKEVKKFLEKNFSIIKNNFLRFIQNLTTIFNAENKNEENNEIKPLEYYLEKRNNNIIMYTVGHCEGGNGKGIIVNVFRKDQIKINDKRFNINSSNKNEEEFEINDPISSFFSFKSNFLLFQIKRNLFFETRQIWLCPISTPEISTFEKILIELNESEPLKFSSNEYLFCLFLVESLKNHIKFHPLQKDFPYDEAIEVKDLNLNCVFKQTSYFYEQNKKMRDIYLNRFSEMLNKDNVSEESKYLSKIGIFINLIDMHIQLNNNKNLIVLYFNIMKIMSQYKYDNFYEFFHKKVFSQEFEFSNQNSFKNNLENNIININSKKSKKSSFVKVKSKTQIYNLYPDILEYLENSIHVNEVSINKMYIDIFFNEETKKNEEIKTLRFILDINNIIYNENEMNVNDINKNKTLAKFFIESFLLSLSIPKNFVNKKDFDSPERIPIWDTKIMMKKFTEMEQEPISEKEKIIVNIEKLYLKLFTDNTVIFEIDNIFKIGFEHNIEGDEIEFENILSIIPKGNEKEDEKNLMEKYEKYITKNINKKKIYDGNQKCVEIKFKKNDIYERDFELDKYKNTFSHFFGIKKILYVLKSTFSYKFIFTAEGTFNIFILNIPNRIFDYIYYFKNWTKLFYLMIEVVYPQKKEKEKEKEKVKKKNNIKNFYTQIYQEEKLLNENELNKSTDVPIKGDEKKIMGIKFPLICISLSKNQKDFQNFIFYNSTLELLKNDNNEKLLRLKIKDFHWKVNESSCQNLIIKNQKYPTKNILEFQMVLDNKDILRNNDKIIHQKIIKMEFCEIVFLSKYINEISLFLDINQLCLNENPKKEKVYKLLNIEPISSEFIYGTFNNVNIIIPESSISSNYMKLNFDSINIQILDDYNEIKIMPIYEKGLYIIDKNTLFGTNVEEVNDKNIKIPDLKENQKLEKYLFGFRKVIAKCNKVTAKVIINKNKKTILKLDDIEVNINIPKVDQISKLYEYYWKINNQNILPMKMGVEINIKKTDINISMGDINAIQHFVDNNFDEKSPLYSEEEAVFNTMNLEAKINCKNDININIFKVFNEFFDNSKPIQKIGNKLPGYDDEITYDTDFD